MYGQLVKNLLYAEWSHLSFVAKDLCFKPQALQQGLEKKVESTLDCVVRLHKCAIQPAGSLRDGDYQCEEIGPRWTRRTVGMD